VGKPGRPSPLIHLNLVRTDFLKEGIFGHLSDENDSILLFTHEPMVITQKTLGEDKHKPYLLPDSHHCARVFRRPHITFEFSRFTSKDAPFFHPGSPDDSVVTRTGILLGLTKAGGTRLLHTEKAFQKFMNYLDGQDSFILRIEE